ncbi:hypothetical protein Ddye_030348 [Dipteronia dyeriana]|uniref:Uncharacterized protein n=1 Tax=Dipteronia dyeriana TaxID=168575 RepID=A0AAD9TGX6_9ROSI|nr:hypothetical protein Ddye_030348 [Dipteronia dyeriana]
MATLKFDSVSTNGEDKKPDPVRVNGGDGNLSYNKNSCYQRLSLNVVREKMVDAITRKLDLKKLSSTSNTIHLADMGCAVGPNTVITMQDIMQVIKNKYQSECPDSKNPEFQIFFNDKSSNDFNTLFSCIPEDRQYFAAAVPGSFHNRLFPEAFLHFVHSAYALHWLSGMPEEMQDENSPAFNRGRVHYSSAPEEVENAYASQFDKDLDNFLNARAKEIVSGGMVVFIVPGIPDGMPCSHLTNSIMYELMGDIFMDLAKEGSISEAQVNSFNLPIYSPYPEQIGQLVEKNGHFMVETIELTDPTSCYKGEIDIKMWTKHVRAAMDGMFLKYFEIGIVDEMFDRLVQRLFEVSDLVNSTHKDKTMMLRSAINVSKKEVDDAITRKLDVKALLSSTFSNTIRIADCGCAVGPNTFYAMQDLIETIKHIYQSQCLSTSQTLLEFQVFFADQPSNDYNTLFTSLPQDRQYFAAGVPGSFHQQMFPESFLHVVHSSYALHWLSKVPDVLMDKNSPAYNKGRILYPFGPVEVVNAYASQFAKDLDRFLSARAKEMVKGGLLIVTKPSIPDGMPYSQTANAYVYDCMATILYNMAKEGLISEAQVDAFNLPLYFCPPGEFSAVVEKNGNFSIEVIGLTNPSPWVKDRIDIAEYIKHIRAAKEGMLNKHFPSEITDAMFKELVERLEVINDKLTSCYREKIHLYTVLQRK